MVLGILLGAEHLARLFLAWVASQLHVSAGVADGTLLMLNVFLLLTYAVVIRAYWIELNRDKSHPA